MGLNWVKKEFKRVLVGFKYIQMDSNVYFDPNGFIMGSTFVKWGSKWFQIGFRRFKNGQNGLLFEICVFEISSV